MLLADLLAHLIQRFPNGTTVLNAEITLLSDNHPPGLVEIVAYEADDDEDGPDDGEKVELRRPHPRLAA